ncbi:cache domain-containing protein [Chlorobaculum parvum]|nr:cache domain-containing protein [Chlorobaculum parvum]
MSRFISILMSAVLALCLLTVRAEAKTEPVPVKLEPEVALGAYMGLLEEHLGGILRTEKVVAESIEAMSGRWDMVWPLLARFSQDLPTDAAVWYMMPDGRYFSTAKGGLTDQNLSDRAYFPTLKAGKEVLGELVISKSIGQRSIIVATPVFSAEGKLVAAIGVSVDAVKLAELVESRMTLPDNTYFYALDANTKVTLHRYQARLFKTVSEVGNDESLGDDFKKVMGKEQGVFDYSLNGKNMTSIFRKSPVLGWYFFIAQEAQEAQEVK